MNKNPLIDLYVNVLNEGVNSPEVKGSTLKPGKDALGDLKEGKNDGPTANTKVEKPKEDKENSDPKGDKGKPSKAPMHKEAANPFDALYQQFISEDFGSEHGVPTDGGMNPVVSGGDESGLSDELPITDENIDEGEDETAEEGGIHGVISALEKALESLRGMVPESEHKDEESEGLDSDEDFEDLGNDDETADLHFGGDLSKESVEIAKAPDKKDAFQGATKSQVVSGGVSAKKGKATTPSTGKGNDGKLEKMADKSGVWQGATKSQDTKLVKPGKSLFEQ